MTYTGEITDNDGKPLQGASYVVTDEKGGVVTSGITDAKGNYSVDMDPDSVENLTVSKSGYKTHTWTSGDFINLSGYDVQLELQKQSNLLLPVAAASALLLVAAHKKKKVGKLDLGTAEGIAVVGVGVVGFFLLKQLLEKFGIWDSAATKDLNNADTNPNSFWSPNFYKQKPANVAWTYELNKATADQYCQTIYDAFGIFNDDEEQAIGVFKLCRTKANVSYLVDDFSALYNQDLLTWLRGGMWPQDRLSDADVETINQYVSQLPDY